MATYDSLTPDEKELLAVWERNTRGWLNSLAALLAQARALDAALNATNGPAAILDSLDPGEVVPNSGAIAGAQNLTKEEWATMRTAGLQDFLTAYDTNAVRRVIAKAAGPTAGL
jgi:hypothetical protein